MDALKNFAYSLVATAPSPATSGTSLTVTAGQGSYFPTTPFDATIWPAGVQPTNSNAEIVRVTAVATDTFTITRAQYGTTAQSITAGYQIAQTVDANLLNQLAPLSGATFTGEVVAPDFKASGLTGATTATRFVGGTTSGSPTSGTFAVGDLVVDQTATIWVCTIAGTPGTWSPTESQNVTLRSATATAALGEITIFGGSTASQTITLPVHPVSGSTYSIVNNASVTVNVKGGTNSLSLEGTNYGATTPYTIPVGSGYNFVFDGTGVWYNVFTTDISNLVGVLGTSNGGTGLTGFTAANNAIYSTSASALTAGTLPVLAGGTGVTTSTGSGNNVLSTSPSLTTPNFSSIVNSGTLTLPTSTDTLVARATTDTLTNKRITKRVLALSANSATPAINTDNYDVVHITSQSTAITSFTSSLTGTPVDGDTLRISITGTTSIALTWGTSFEASGTSLLPTTTSSTTRLDVGFFWNTETSKWRCVAVA